MSSSTNNLAASASGETQETFTTAATTMPATSANDFKNPTSATSVKSEDQSANTGAIAEVQVSEKAVTAQGTKNGEKSKTENEVKADKETASASSGEWKCKDLEPDSDEDDGEDDDDDDEGYGDGDEGFDDGARYGTATARGWL